VEIVIAVKVKDNKNTRRTKMAPIIPAGGKKMDWASNLEPIQKQAQGMFEDDPQLQAIKDLPGMKDGIDELESMSAECASCEDGRAPEFVTTPIDEVSATPASGAVEQAVEKVKDAAQEVAEAAAAEVEKTVTDAIGSKKPVVEEIVHETSETLADDKKDDKDDKDDTDIPGVKDDVDGIGKESGDEKSASVTSGTKLRRIAELAPDEIKELRNYWQNLLGFPKEYVTAMLKNYKA
jgi:hypothetical protein